MRAECKTAGAGAGSRSRSRTTVLVSEPLRFKDSKLDDFVYSPFSISQCSFSDSGFLILRVLR